MRLKLDENLPQEAATLLHNVGHDAHTVNEEKLGGSSDLQIAEVCQDESRVLLTLDTHFCNIVNYPPKNYPGIIVIRIPSQSKRAVLESIESRVLPLLTENLVGLLLIVQENGIRVR